MTYLYAEDVPHFVYRTYDASDRLLYIGCTKNPEQREATHRRSSEWAQYAVRFEVEGPFSRSAGYARERHAIDTELPFFNATTSETAAAQANRRECRRLLGMRGIPAPEFYDDSAPDAARDWAGNVYAAAMERMRRSLPDFPYLDWHDRMRIYLATLEEQAAS